MSLCCQICKTKLQIQVHWLSTEKSSCITKCGHLFHLNCLEGFLTSQKLKHATSGHGPFRPVCPLPSCYWEVNLDEVITLQPTYEEEPETDESSEYDEILTNKNKHIKQLQAETDKLQATVNELEHKNHELKNALHAIRFELEDIRAFLYDDDAVRKGDRVFCVSKVGHFIPAKVLKLSMKSNEQFPYVILDIHKSGGKLRKKSSSNSPNDVYKDNMAVPVQELVTFKAFFKDVFQDVSLNLQNIWSELSSSGKIDDYAAAITAESRVQSPIDESEDLNSPSTASTFTSPNSPFVKHRTTVRKKFARSQSSGIFAATFDDETPSYLMRSASSPNDISNSAEVDNMVSDITSPTFEGLEKVNENSSEMETSGIFFSTKRSSQTSGGNDDFNLELRRNKSCSSMPPSDYAYYPTITPAGISDTPRCIAEGDRILWTEPGRDIPFVGTITFLLEYSKCAIVNFDGMPLEQVNYQYRTCPTKELTPFESISQEMKNEISEAYGMIFLDLFDLEEFA